eukprot:2275439-Pyramimonas_sp.AAC.1
MVQSSLPRGEGIWETISPLRAGAHAVRSRRSARHSASRSTPTARSPSSADGSNSTLRMAR